MRSWVTASVCVLALGAVEHGKLAAGARALVARYEPAPPRPRALPVVPLGDAHTGSAVVLAKVGDRVVAYVADEDDAVIHVVDESGLTELGATPLAARPGQLLVLPDGRLLAAIRGGSEVVALRIGPGDPSRLTLERAWPTTPEPIGLATTPDGQRLLVTSGWGRTLSIFEVGSGRELTRVGLPRDPRAVLTSRDGSKAFVSHAVGSQISVVDLVDPGHSVIASSVDGWSEEEPGFAGSRFLTSESGSVSTGDKPQPVHHARMACQGFALARVDSPAERVLAPQVQVETGDTTVRSSGYGSAGGLAAEIPNVAVLPVDTGIADARSMEVFATTRSFSEVFDPGAERLHGFRVERAQGPCVLPRAAVAGSGRLFVACLGIDAVVEYDADVAAPQRVERRRWHVPSGPEALALIEDRLYVWSQFARTLTVLEVADEHRPDTEAPSPDVAAIARATEAPQITLSRRAGRAARADVELGRELFHATGDRRISFDGRGCASCHPDGRDDALTWSTPAGPRQTPMLAGRIAETSPYGWDGEGKDVATHLTHTFQRLQGRGLAPQELAALMGYVASLPVPPRATRARTPAERDRIARGSALFHSKPAECSTCHSGDGAFTDAMDHDIGSKLEADAKPDFDTPSLRFVSGTAPYFHDGRYATLRDVLTHTDGAMGHTAELSPDDLDALEAYVATL